MDDFLIKFFPNVHEKKHRAHENNYCKFDDQWLQLFTSSLYLSAIVFSLGASFVCKKKGRRFTMRAASLFFFLGVVFSTAAVNVWMLIIGRVLLGAGVGFGNQAVPLFISEIAPPKYRGGLNIMFQLAVTIGILCANLVNYLTSGVHSYGWRISLGGAAVPAVILGVGSFFIVETPTSLIEQGEREKGLASLKRVRGVDNVNTEYEEIVAAVEKSNQVTSPFMNLMKRENRPQLICGTILQVFQQFTGINVIMFYAPVLFQTMGFGNDASLLSAVVTGMVNVVATLVAVFVVDRLGRKVLLIEAAVQMLIAQVAMGTILLVFLKATGDMSALWAKVVVFLVCFYVAGFAWSWGPLGWLIPSEIYPLETRNAGFFCAVGTNMLCTFIVAQAFLTMLCTMKSFIFYFFSVWIVAMGLFAIFILPETKGVPIDEMNEKVWKKHWLWKRFFDKVEVKKASL